MDDHVEFTAFPIWFTGCLNLGQLTSSVNCFFQFSVEYNLDIQGLNWPALVHPEFRQLFACIVAENLIQ
jgi:hypothetical protein